MGKGNVGVGVGLADVVNPTDVGVGDLCIQESIIRLPHCPFSARITRQRFAGCSESSTCQ